MLLHPFPITPKSVYGPVREAIERRKALDDRLSHFREVFIESTAASPDSFFYRKHVIEKRIYDGVIWDDAPDFHATGFPDFLPGSGK